MALKRTKTEIALLVILALPVLAGWLVGVRMVVTGSPLLVSAAPTLLPVALATLLLIALLERREFWRWLQRYSGRESRAARHRE